MKREKTDDDDESPTSVKGPSTECIDVPDNAYEDGVVALQAKEQITKFSKENKPYFMAVGFHKPHLPFVAPKNIGICIIELICLLHPFKNILKMDH